MGALRTGTEAEFLGPDPNTYVLRCVVTKQMSSAIIGPKGNNARAIREESACKVRGFRTAEAGAGRSIVVASLCWAHLRGAFCLSQAIRL